MPSNELHHETSAQQTSAKPSGVTNKAMDELKSMLEGAGYSVKKKSKLLKETAIEYTKTHPAESIIISALTGALIALLLRK